MKRFCSILYKNLQQDLLRCKKTTPLFEAQVETCFQVAYRYWKEVKENLSSYEFKNDRCEIEFFKQCKPKFTSEIEYYELLYHAVVFEPPATGDAILFWNRESQRLQKFEEEHKSFLLCYADHCCSLLPYYFLRRYSEIGTRQPKLYDTAIVHRTNGDPLVAAFWALKRYVNYVYKKQAELPNHIGV